MKNGVLLNFTRSHISSDRMRSGYEIRLMLLHVFSTAVCDFKKVFDLTIPCKDTHIFNKSLEESGTNLRGNFAKLTSCNTVTTILSGGP